MADWFTVGVQLHCPKCGWVMEAFKVPPEHYSCSNPFCEYNKVKFKPPLVKMERIDD